MISSVWNKWIRLTFSIILFNIKTWWNFPVFTTCCNDCVCVNFPFCINCYVACWHCIKFKFIHKCFIIYKPTCERITFFCWIWWFRDLSIIILGDWIEFCSTITFECDCVLFYIPFCINSCITCWHCGKFKFIFKCFIIYKPTCECIPFFSWVIWFCDCCVIVLSYWINLSSSIWVKCYCVLIYLPFCI